MSFSWLERSESYGRNRGSVYIYCKGCRKVVMKDGHGYRPSGCAPGFSCSENTNDENTNTDNILYESDKILTSTNTTLIRGVNAVKGRK